MAENSLCTLAPEHGEFDVKFVLDSCILLSVKRHISCHLSALRANCSQYLVPGIDMEVPNGESHLTL